MVPGKWVWPVFLLTLLAGASVLGPVIYYGVNLVTPLPFHRAMDRALLISAVAALGLFWGRIPLAQLWPWDGGAWKGLLLGFAMAAVAVQALLGLDLAVAGFTNAHRGAGQTLGRIGLALVAAILAAPLEETLFRGFIQRELVAALGWRAGWVLGAAIYMLAHFLKIPVELDREPVHFWSGVMALGAAFVPVLQGDFLGGRGLNLFLLGLILGGVFLRSGTLWVNAGLHSGLILALLLFTGLTRPIEPPAVAIFGGDLLSSLATTVVLLLLGFWLWRFYRHPSILPETGENAP